MGDSMLRVIAGIVARCAIVVGAAFILGSIVPRMPRNKLYRFVFWFTLCVPLNLGINYVDVSMLGYHKMGWTGAFMIAFLVAICGTFWPTQPHKSNTP